MSVRIAALAAADHVRWLVLARGYKAFYKTQVSAEEYERAWKRLLASDRVWGLGAHLDGELVGVTHYLFHTGTWNEEVCYLQDLFVEPARSTIRSRSTTTSSAMTIPCLARR